MLAQNHYLKDLAKTAPPNFLKIALKIDKNRLICLAEASVKKGGLKTLHQFLSFLIFLHEYNGRAIIA